MHNVLPELVIMVKVQFKFNWSTLEYKNMVWTYVVAFSLKCLFGNAVGEDAVSKNFRFKIFPDTFLINSSSLTTEAPDLLGIFTFNFSFNNKTSV